MEAQEILELETGTKESTTLTPQKVKIVDVEIRPVKEGSTNIKASFSVKHPDKEESIHISSVKYENKGKLSISGTWVNLDEDNKLRKNSALANFIAFLKCNTLKAMIGKECDTVEDEKGYLCFKAY